MEEVNVENKDPIFVIGFPKSGNTWLARLLAEATESNMNPRNSVDAADYSLERKGNYLIYKEHVVQNIDDVLQCKVIYIVRDVRDVLISGFFHCNRWCNEKLIKENIFCRWYFNHEISKLNKKWQGNIRAELTYKTISLLMTLVRHKREKVRIGSWSNHVIYWTKKTDVVVVRYEDLLQNTEGEMRRILDELKISVDDGVLKKTISNQSFGKKKKEFLHSGDSHNSKFLRTGKAGGWRDLLSSNIVKKIEVFHGQVMNEYKYILEYKKGEK